MKVKFVDEDGNLKENTNPVEKFKEAVYNGVKKAVRVSYGPFDFEQGGEEEFYDEDLDEYITPGDPLPPGQDWDYINSWSTVMGAAFIYTAKVNEVNKYVLLMQDDANFGPYSDADFTDEEIEEVEDEFYNIVRSKLTCEFTWLDEECNHPLGKTWYDIIQNIYYWFLEKHINKHNTHYPKNLCLHFFEQIELDEKTVKVDPRLAAVEIGCWLYNGVSEYASREI